MSGKYISRIKALTFDVFGTLTDWRGTIVREGGELNLDLGTEIDWAKFADAWRAGYSRETKRVRSGEIPWQTIDSLHRGILDALLVEFEFPPLEEWQKERLNRVWHRLDAWPDVKDGLTRLRQGYVVAPFSNGNFSLLVDLTRHSRFDLDCILSAEMFRRYKSDPKSYLCAVELLGLKPEEVMMVASHNSDLKGARAAGLATAFVCRPIEHGPDQSVDLVADPEVDIACRDLSDLADKLDVMKVDE